MTTIVLALQNLMVKNRRMGAAGGAVSALAICRREKIFTFVVIGIGIAILIYVGTSLWTFNLKTIIEEKNKRLIEMTEKNISFELALRRNERTFTETHKDVINAMEKISSIRYLQPTNVVVSEVIMAP